MSLPVPGLELFLVVIVPPVGDTLGVELPAVAAPSGLLSFFFCSSSLRISPTAF